MKKILFICIYILFFNLLAETNNIMHYYKVKDLKDDMFIAYVQYIEKNYPHEYMSYYKDSRIIVIKTDVLTHKSIKHLLYDFKVIPQKIYKKEHSFTPLSHIFYEMPAKFRKEREKLAKEINLKIAKQPKEKIIELMNLQGKASDFIKMPYPRKDAYYYESCFCYILTMVGTDKKEYIVWIRTYDSIFFMKGDTYLRFSVFDKNNGSICYDISLQIETGSYHLKSFHIIEKSNLNILELVFVNDYTKIMGIDSEWTIKKRFLINGEGFLLLKDKSYKLSNQIGTTYSKLPQEGDLLNFLYSSDAIKEILACQILKDFKEKNGKENVKLFLSHNQNEVIKKQILLIDTSED